MNQKNIEVKEVVNFIKRNQKKLVRNTENIFDCQKWEI